MQGWFNIWRAVNICIYVYTICILLVNAYIHYYFVFIFAYFLKNYCYTQWHMETDICSFCSLRTFTITTLHPIHAHHWLLVPSCLSLRPLTPGSIHLQSHPDHQFYVLSHKPQVAAQSPFTHPPSHFAQSLGFQEVRSIPPVPSGESSPDRPDPPPGGWGIQTLATSCTDGWEALTGKVLPKGRFFLFLFTLLRESQQETLTRCFLSTSL